MPPIIRVPSINLIHRLGLDNPEEFLITGYTLFENLKSTGSLLPNSKVLEIGSNCGCLARYAYDYLDPRGSYTGLDAHSGMVHWSNENLVTLTNNFSFRAIDFGSKDITLPYPDQSFDLVILNLIKGQSLMGYLHEVHRVLKAGGRCYCNAYLEELNSNQIPVDYLTKKGFTVTDFINGAQSQSQDIINSLWRHDPKGHDHDTIIITKTGQL